MQKLMSKKKDGGSAQGRTSKPHSNLFKEDYLFFLRVAFFLAGFLAAFFLAGAFFLAAFFFTAFFFLAGAFLAAFLLAFFFAAICSFHLLNLEYF